MELHNRLRLMVSTTAFRLGIGITAVFLIIAGSMIAILAWQTNAVLTDQVMTTLSAEAEALRSEARQGSSKALIDAVAARSRPDGPGLYFLANAAGEKLSGNLSRAPPELLPDQQGGVFRFRPDINSPSRERLGVAISMAMPSGERLIVGRDVDDQRTYAEGVKRLFMISFFALALAGLLTAFMISRLVLKRIESINAASREIMAGDFSRRVPLQGSGDELDGLASNLNAMLDRIEQLMAGLREVSENIAHDLKTPLNRLRNRVEAALRDSAGETAYRDALGRTIEEADDLIKTFNALLLIAKLEASALDRSAYTLDCGALVRDVAELYGPLAEEKGIDFEIDTANGPMIVANRQLIGQAVANVIDNAIKYGPASSDAKARSKISIQVKTIRNEVEITIADQGPGIAAVNRERALKRFVRLDESRSQPGTGLGLSLVSAVARLHGGRVVLEDNDPGLRVSLILPLPSLSASKADPPNQIMFSRMPSVSAET